MENASKALIIAGSILVSIVIITLGVMIVSNVTETINKNSNLSEQEVSQYNSKFEAYLGTKSGSQVKALCDLVRTHNNAHLDDETQNVKIGSGAVPTNSQEPALSAVVAPSVVNAFKGTIKAGKTYSVEFSYDSNTGLIVGIYVNEKP